MKTEFSNLSEIYEESVRRISSYPSDGKSDQYLENSERFVNLLGDSEKVIWIGTGRQEEVANFAAMLTKANDKSTFCSSDTSIPYRYEPDDLVVALSSSGETERTVHYAKSAFKPIGESTPVVAITTNPNSTLARIAEKTGGFAVRIPGESKGSPSSYQEKQFMGEHEPLTLGGTLGELHALEFILGSIGSAVSATPTLEYHQNFWEEVESYNPDPRQSEKLYEMLPNPVNNSEMGGKVPNKTVIGGLGLSGIIARAFSIRLAHCSGEGKERWVNFYRDAGNIATRQGDLAIAVSGSGQEFWKDTLEPIKKSGGKVAAVTSFGDSPLGQTADLCIEVPGRKRTRDRSKLENPPASPEQALFEVRSLFALEAFIYCLVREEKISIQAIEGKHPRVT